MMDRKKSELKPLFMSLLFLVLGIVVLWATRSFISDPTAAMGDAVFVSLLVMPILIYAIISGSLTEIRGPGGVGATFNTVAASSVTETIQHDRVSVEENSQILTKGGIGELKQQLKDLNENSPIVMTVTFGGGHYTPEAMFEYVHALSSSRNFRFVVFVDREGRVVAYMPPWAVRNILNTPGAKEEFVRVINQGNRDLLSYPGIVEITITTSSTNAETLRKMAEKNIDALIVTDENNRLKGVAEREQVLSKMMLALIK